MTPFEKHRHNYMLYGALFGLFFPVIAIIILLIEKNSWSINQVVLLHQESALLWIIDTAPVFLGLFASFAGQKLDVLNKKQNELQEKYLENIKLKEVAENAIEIKTEFFTSMSHELRTPLTSIIGYNELLSENPLSKKQIEYNDIIKEVSYSMLDIVNDLLDTSKIEKKNITLYNDNFNINETYIMVCKSLRSIVNKEVEFTFETDFQNKYVYGDINRIKQIFRNLIGNAIKFTDKGSIHSKLKINEIGNDNIKIEFEVVDTGVGIREEFLKDIFKPYSLIEDKKKSGILSTGLGLSITSQLVKLMNGEINVSSNFGYGSTFSFFITLKKGIKTNPEGNGKMNFKDLKGNGTVLLAEDNKMNQTLITKILNDWNLQVNVANDGKEALSLLKKNNFDLILMDAEMPIMGGFETSENIRKSKLSFSEIPIVFLSANKFDDENLLMEKYGVKHFLTKPYNLTNLSNAINDYIVLS